MIIKVEQTKSNFKNKFQIKVNNEVKYLAGTPWMDIDLPLGIDRIRTSIITTPDESLCFKTAYDIVENISNTAIPMKWVVTGEQKSLIYNIFNKDNINCAKFYKLINDFFDTKYVIEYGNYSLKVYDISIGKTRNLSIYKDDIQIAEIVKPMSVSNNLDYYYIFLLDEYSDLETIISFFIVFFDYQNYANGSQIVAKKETISINYTYDKNNKYYDKNWILNHFDKQEVDVINNQILQDRKDSTNKIKKQAKFTVSLIIVFWVIMLIIFAVIYFGFIK